MVDDGMKTFYEVLQWAAASGAGGRRRIKAAEGRRDGLIEASLSPFAPPFPPQPSFAPSLSTHALLLPRAHWCVSKPPLSPKFPPQAVPHASKANVALAFAA